MRKELMKISKVYVGFGGYQEAQIGIWFQFSSPGSGVGDGSGAWATEWTKDCKWSKQDRLNTLGEIFMQISEWLSQAKVDSVYELNGIPVEVIFEGNALKEWRILTEVL